MNKYNSRYRSTTKMKDMNVKSSTYIGFNNKTIRKVLNLELVIMLKYQNIRTFFAKSYIPNSYEEVVRSEHCALDICY